MSVVRGAEVLCQACGRPFEPRIYKWRGTQQRFHSRECFARGEELLLRVQRRLVRRGDCLVWTGATNNWGYGQIGVGDRVLYVHRVVFESNYGDLATGTEVCHTCDNPPCCEPSHLFAGTHRENMKDCSAKGRMHTGSARGEAHGLAKLTTEAVLLIRQRRAAGLTQRQVAQEFGVSVWAISDIDRRRSWAHV